MTYYRLEKKNLVFANKQQTSRRTMNWFAMVALLQDF
jgi:hypothetical protein